MSYSNIIYLLVVILLFTTSSPADRPQFVALYGGLFFLGKTFLFREIVRFFFRRYRIRQASHYFAAEQRVSILAILFLAIDVYLLDCQYYFAKLPLAERLPTLVDLSGVLLFFFYMAIVWSEASKSYYEVFGRYYGRLRFIANNLKINGPIILPWLFISLFADLLQLLDIPALSWFLDSAWGGWAVLLAFFLVLAVFFPVGIVRLWGCRPLPAGEARSRIESFCERQKLKYANILTWPLFEGEVLTAGVIGIVGRFRYLLVTPALLRTMEPVEIEAVMAHEIGHVKKYHMQLYLFLFIGFSLLAPLVTYPVLYGLLNSNLFYKAILLTSKEPGSALALVTTFSTTVPLLVLMIVYFRFVFGFFMRNFERQADLHVFEAMGTSGPLINVLEKIGILSGNIRDLPSWHHFGIGQRVDFLSRCQSEPDCIKKHNGKVRTALIAYTLALALAGFLSWTMPDRVPDVAPRERLVEAFLQQKTKEDPQNFIWQLQLGDLQHWRKHYHEAIAAYEKALDLLPNNAEIMNNLAWVLLTAEDESVRDADRALVLAHDAAKLKPHGYIFDTLALAYWQNGYTASAIRAEKEAIAKDPTNRDYYEKQLKIFSGEEKGALPGEETRQ